MLGATTDEGGRAMSAGRILAIVFGVLAILIGLGVVAAGAGVLIVNGARDSDGFLTSGTERITSDGYALVSEDIDVEGPWPDDLVDIRIRAEARESDQAVFVGIARTEDVERYLVGVPYDLVRDVDVSGFGDPDISVATTPRPGVRAPAPPITESFWEARVAGVGEQTLDWSVESGRWTFVVMRASGARGVEADVALGFGFPSLLWLGVGILIFGAFLLVGGAVLVLVGARRRRPPTDGGPADTSPVGPVVDTTATTGISARASPYPGAPAAEEHAPTPYPVALEGTLDPGLSRWLWLVKWLLAIPHYVVLFFLSIAGFVLTIVAFFSIVFTGRYPRGIFDFNVGVLRWQWRVSFYALGAIGTDRYPPFTLDDVPDYPARLEIPYPERLSRGLVWVKSWLLAIPHYLVVGILVGGWYAGWDEAAAAYGIGLIGILVLIAGVALLFTGVYPASIFRLVIGFNRWVYRVYAYAALMRDEYPPFRLER
jgi:hypothetical protein